MRTAAVMFSEVDAVIEGTSSFTLDQIDAALTELCGVRTEFPAANDRIDWLLAYRTLKESG